MDRDEMDALTANTAVKSEKIRRLYSAGVTAADIGRYLDIRYQHVYNVLLRAGLIAKDKTRNAAAVASPAILLPIAADGTVKFPSEILDAHGLQAGGSLVCRSGPDGLIIMSRDRAVDYLRDVARSRMPEEASLFEALLGRTSNTEPDPPT